MIITTELCTTIHWDLTFQLENRIIEDHAVVYFGAALFKIVRLLVVATLTVHLIACIFYRVKVASCFLLFLFQQTTKLIYGPGADRLRKFFG